MFSFPSSKETCFSAFPMGRSKSTRFFFFLSRLLDVGETVVISIEDLPGLFQVERILGDSVTKLTTFRKKQWFVDPNNGKVDEVLEKPHQTRLFYLYYVFVFFFLFFVTLSQEQVPKWYETKRLTPSNRKNGHASLL